MAKIVKCSFEDVPVDQRQYMKFNTLRPDTCDCILEYFWDTRTDEDNREHHPHKIVDVCEHHKHHHGGDAHKHHVEIIEENSHKNQSITHILEILGRDHKITLKGDDGTETEWFKQMPAWNLLYKSSNSFRDLEIKIHHATEEEKQKASDMLRQKFPERIVHIK